MAIYPPSVPRVAVAVARVLDTNPSGKEKVMRVIRGEISLLYGVARARFAELVLCENTATPTPLCPYLPFGIRPIRRRMT